MKDRIDFLIAGVQKCGTTALWKLLRQHPEVCISAKKELHFFDQKLYEEGDEHFLRYHLRGWGSTKLNGDFVYGEATPKYTLVDDQGKPLFLSRIRSYNPNIKLIVLFRDPVERAHSQWYMLRKNNSLILPFGDLIDQLLDGKEKRFRDIINRGLYGSILTSLISYFPAGNCLFLIPEDLHRNMDEITSFLGVSSFPFRPVHSLINDGKGCISRSTVDKLRRFYRDEVHLFSDLTGADVSSWLD